MPRKTKQQLRTGAGWGWFKKTFHKVKRHIFGHVKKHGARAIAHAKKVGKQAYKDGKAAAIATGTQVLQQAKEEGKRVLKSTIDDATKAAVGHVRKHVCSKVGSGFFNAQRDRLIKMAHSEMEKVHRKGIAHVRSGGRGGALSDHVDKAKERVENSVEKIKNTAKSSIRAVAGCDEQGSGFSTRGAGVRMRGAGLGGRSRKKSCRCV